MFRTSFDIERNFSKLIWKKTKERKIKSGQNKVCIHWMNALYQAVHNWLVSKVKKRQIFQDNRKKWYLITNKIESLFILDWWVNPKWFYVETCVFIYFSSMSLFGVIFRCNLGPYTIYSCVLIKSNLMFQLHGYSLSNTLILNWS